ncbi:DUF2783 domain-containing protein [Sphingobium sp.]|uniref:DUF2783 domain-containing protein n=1 Tax=Sphingobium sp. TaxID=1912891 RepID=UPI00257BD8DE|nr:DUF2783 domain-containing protein [Sphingobium sp.]
MLLQVNPSPAASDELFDLLAQAHEGLDPVASARLNSMVVLLLANHIGAIDVIRSAIETAQPLLETPTDRLNK